MLLSPAPNKCPLDTCIRHNSGYSSCFLNSYWTNWLVYQYCLARNNWLVKHRNALANSSNCKNYISIILSHVLCFLKQGLSSSLPFFVTLLPLFIIWMQLKLHESVLYWIKCKCICIFWQKIAKCKQRMNVDVSTSKYIDFETLIHNFVVFCESAPLETKTVATLKLKFHTWYIHIFICMYFLIIF